MTTVEMRQVETAKPGRPWRATPRERAFAIGNFIAAFLLAFVLVKFTGLNGNLVGYSDSSSHIFQSLS